MDKLLKISTVALTILAAIAFIGRFIHMPYYASILTVSMSALCMVVPIRGISHMAKQEINTFTQLCLLAYYGSLSASVLCVLFRSMLYPGYGVLLLFVYINIILLIFLLLSGRKQFIPVDFWIVHLYYLYF